MYVPINLSHTLVLSMNSVTVTSQFDVNYVTLSQSLRRGWSNIKTRFMVKWKKKNIVLDQSERSIFNEYNIIMTIYSARRMSLNTTFKILYLKNVFYSCISYIHKSYKIYMFKRWPIVSSEHTQWFRKSTWPKAMPGKKCLVKVERPSQSQHIYVIIYCPSIIPLILYIVISSRLYH